MGCKERQDLVAWLDGELDEARSNEVGAHVERCDDCAREVELLRRSYASLEFMGEVEVPEGLAQGVAARMSARMPRTRQRVLMPVFAAAAALLLVVGLAALRLPGRQTDITTPVPSVLMAGLSAEEREVVENLELLEDYEILSDFELLAQYETLEVLEQFPDIDSI